MSALPAFDVFTRQKRPEPDRRHAAMSGSIESLPIPQAEKQKIFGGNALSILNNV